MKPPWQNYIDIVKPNHDTRPLINYHLSYAPPFLAIWMVTYEKVWPYHNMDYPSPHLFNWWFSHYVIAAMLVDINKRFLQNFFCLFHQHGCHAFVNWIFGDWLQTINKECRCFGDPNSDWIMQKMTTSRNTSLLLVLNFSTKWIVNWILNFRHTMQGQIYYLIKRGLE